MSTYQSVTTWRTMPHGAPVDVCPECEAILAVMPCEGHDGTVRGIIYGECQHGAHLGACDICGSSSRHD